MTDTGDRSHPGRRDALRLNARLRLSGLLATVVFLVMAASDLLMLTTLDFSRPYSFWTDAPGLPQQQVTWGYYLGVLTIPFYVVGGWHLSLAIRPAGSWASLWVLVAFGYTACLCTVWHASFAFTRSIVRAELAAGTGVSPGPEALLAFGTYAMPLFRFGLGLAGSSFLLAFGLAVLGRTHYPRWAGVALPALYILVAVLLGPYVPVWAGVVLRAGGWNLGGVALFALSTTLLWNRMSEDSAAVAIVEA